MTHVVSFLARFFCAASPPPSPRAAFSFGRFFVAVFPSPSSPSARCPPSALATALAALAAAVFSVNACVG